MAQLKSKKNKKKEETQEKLSKTNNVIISLFSLFLISRFHGNVGLNKLVKTRHFLFLLPCESILINGKMKPCRYGLLARIALHALYAWKASLLGKKREYVYIHELHGNFVTWVGYNGTRRKRDTQKKLSITNRLIISHFSLFLLSCFHGNFGRN